MRRRSFDLIAVVAASVVLGIAGCDSTLTPGQELYALKNPARSWRIPVAVPADPRAARRLRIDDQRVEFGLVEPAVPTTKEVTIRNLGNAELALARSDNHPTLRVLPSPKLTIAPGEKCQLRIRWRPHASQAAPEVRFRTNDPEHAVLVLKLAGEVRGTILVEPHQFRAPRARPDQPTRTRVLVSSERWSDFEITHISSNIPSLMLHREPASAATLRQYGQRSGWFVHAELPANLPEGELVGKSVSIRVRPIDNCEPSRELTIPIEARVLRRLAVYGDGVDEQGTVHFGIRPVGQTHTAVLCAKVRDPELKLAVRDVVADPPELQARLTPWTSAEQPDGLYRLEISLPATAPPSVHRGNRLGEITLRLDHPRIRELKLLVDYVLVGRDRHVAVSKTSS